MKRKINKSNYLYNKYADMIEITWSGENFVAERIDDVLTILRKHDTDEIIGIQVKNINQIIDEKNPKPTSY